MLRALAWSAVAALLVAGCASARTSPAAPTPTPPASVTPLPPGPTEPTPVPTPTQLPWTASAGTLAWNRLATLPASDLEGVVGFASGYVALEGSAGSAWFSADGRSWELVELPTAGLPGAGPDANGLMARTIATNGREVLIVGGYQHEPCGRMPPGSTGGFDCAISPLAWVSDDGVGWRPADLVPDDEEQSELVAVWPVADGWIAALSDWYGVCLGGKSLWQSPDGVSWEGYAPDPPTPWEGYEHAPFGVAGAAGESLLAASSRCDGEASTLALMTGGGAWRIARGFPTGAEVITGAGPAGSGSRWVLGGLARDTTGCGEDEADDCGSSTPTIWSSVDGADWTTVTLPAGRGVPSSDPELRAVQVTSVTSLVLSDRGYVAVGADADPSVGARHETWVSQDGAEWLQLRQPESPRFDYGPRLVADGPAGVIGISGSENEDEVVVWRLGVP
jgi:hypothetical protein